MKPIKQMTPEQYASHYYAARPWLRDEWQEKRLEEECRALRESNPIRRRIEAPEFSERFYVKDGRTKDQHLVCETDLRIFGHPDKRDSFKKPFFVEEYTESVVNDRNCYYRKITFHCPTCGAESSFVDVTSIHFLAKEDQEETKEYSFLELSETPACKCDNCNSPLFHIYYNDYMLKRTVSFRLVQFLKHGITKDCANAKKKPLDVMLPPNGKSSLEFIGSKARLGVNGYSYLVHTYECGQCKTRYNICDISSLRREPVFIPKDLRATYMLLTKSKDLDERTKMRKIYEELKKKDKEKRRPPREQLALPPYCLECGYNFYVPDLHEGDILPAFVDTTYHDNSLFI